MVHQTDQNNLKDKVKNIVILVISNYTKVQTTWIFTFALNSGIQGILRFGVQ